MSENDDYEFTIKMERKDNYKFEVDFGSELIPNIVMDEPTDLEGGEGKGPYASMLIAAAVGNCLSASLAFCATKKQIELLELRTVVRLKKERNEQGFWRISKIKVDLEPVVEDKENSNFLKCKDIFQNFCIASKSIEDGIPIEVNVLE
ncbi:MAG: OsmC family protein [Candidatus Heimdallarchaeaceae archaeon]